MLKDFFLLTSVCVPMRGIIENRSRERERRPNVAFLKNAFGISLIDRARGIPLNKFTFEESV